MKSSIGGQGRKSLRKSLMGSINLKNLENYNSKPIAANVAYCEELNFFYDFNTGMYYDIVLSSDQNLMDDGAKP
jgi:hypothetical protein